MTISGVSSGFGAYQPGNTQQGFSQFRQDFRDLGAALQSGDMTGAQTAFSALQQLMQGGQSGSQGQQQNNSGQNQLSLDLAALGKALQSGDPSSAKDAFAKLQQDMQAAGQTHHRRHSHHLPQSSANAQDSTLAAGIPAAPDSDGDNDSSGSGSTVNVSA
jgi:hypothetical protein